MQRRGGKAKEIRLLCLPLPPLLLRLASSTLRRHRDSFSTSHQRTARGRGERALY
ncbi:hypothetical protein MUK42_35031, partial [Musa troglodytarum]